MLFILVLLFFPYLDCFVVFAQNYHRFWLTLSVKTLGHDNTLIVKRALLHLHCSALHCSCQPSHSGLLLPAMRSARLQLGVPRLKNRPKDKLLSSFNNVFCYSLSWLCEVSLSLQLCSDAICFASEETRRPISTLRSRCCHARRANLRRRVRVASDPSELL